MNKDIKSDYIKYRIERAFDTIEDAKILVQSKRWNSSINRLYYALFYAVSALLLKYDYQTKTHNGIKSQFSLHFIKTGILSKGDGDLFSDLSDWRNQGDYGDRFDFDEKTVTPLIVPVEQMIKKIQKLIDK